MKICPICKKGTIIGGKRSNRVRATQFNPTGKKRKYPNLQWARLPNGKRIKICTDCLKKGKHLTEIQNSKIKGQNYKSKFKSRFG